MANINGEVIAEFQGPDIGRCRGGEPRQALINLSLEDRFGLGEATQQIFQESTIWKFSRKMGRTARQLGIVSKPTCQDFSFQRFFCTLISQSPFCPA